MKTTLSILLIVLVLQISCKQKNNVKELKTEIKTEVFETKIEAEKGKKNIEEKKEIPFIENDSIVTIWFSELAKMDDSNIDFKISKQPYINRHDDSIIDTIQTLIFDKSKIMIYVGDNFKGLMSANIKNPEFIFSSGIKVGAEKSELEKILGTNIKNSIIKIGNLEQKTLFLIKFNNDTIESINYEGYVD